MEGYCIVPIPRRPTAESQMCLTLLRSWGTRGAVRVPPFPNRSSRVDLDNIQPECSNVSFTVGMPLVESPWTSVILRSMFSVSTEVGIQCQCPIYYPYKPPMLGHKLCYCRTDNTLPCIVQWQPPVTYGEHANGEEWDLISASQ